MAEAGREEQLAAIEKLVAFFRLKPEIDLPQEWKQPMGLSIFANTREEFLAMRKAFGPGKWEKDATGSFYTLQREIMPGILVSLWILADRVCTRVTKRVLVPARDEPEHYEERVEWKCADSILKNQDESV